MTVRAILLRAAELLATEGGFTQCATARDAQGERLNRASDPNAVCWCAGGAIHAAAAEISGDESGPDFYAAVALAAQADCHGDDGTYALDWLIRWSDTVGRRQAEVVDLMRRAAARAPA